MTTINLEEFGNKIMYLREKSGKSQEEICSILGVTQQTLSRYEKGQRQASLDFVVKASQFFNVSSDYLLGLSEIPSTDAGIQNASKITGLNENAIDNLKFIKKNLSNVSNLFISNSIFLKINRSLYNYINQCANIRYIEKIQKNINEYFELKKIKHKDLERKEDYIEALGIVLRCVGCGNAKKYSESSETIQKDIAEYNLFKNFFSILNTFEKNTALDDVLVKNFRNTLSANLSGEIRSQRKSGNNNISNILEGFQAKYNLYYQDDYEEITVEEYEKLTGEKVPSKYITPGSIVRIKKEVLHNAQHNPKEE